MNFIKKFILIIFLIIIMLSCNTKDFSDESVGLKLNFSNHIILNKSEIISSAEWKKLRQIWKGKYVLFINSELLKDSDLFERQYPGPNVTEQQLLELLKIGGRKMFNSTGIDKSYSYFKNKNIIIGEKYFYMGNDYGDLWTDSTIQTMSPNEIYYIKLCLLRNSHLITINLTYNDTDMDIPKKYSKFFIKNNNVWFYNEKNTPNVIYDLIIQKSKEAPKELVKLVEYFDIIEKSIVFID